MASAAPTKLQVRMLHDVDGTIISLDERGVAILNPVLTQFSLDVQYRLKAAGAEVLHHLFTSRMPIFTIAYALMDFIASGRDVRGKSMSLLTNIVAEAQARGLAFDSTLPVVQLWDAVQHIQLGQAYSKYHKPLEQRLMEREQAFFQDLDRWLTEEGHEGDAIEGVQRALAAIEKALYTGTPMNAMMAEILNADRRDDHYRGYFSGRDYLKKTGMLAKLFAATDTRNTHFIWMDDKAELYAQALADKTTRVHGEPLADVVKRCVIFIHHDIDGPPMTAREYWDLLIRETSSKPEHALLHRHLMEPTGIEVGGGASTVGMAFTEVALAPTAAETDATVARGGEFLPI